MRASRPILALSFLALASGAEAAPMSRPPGGLACIDSQQIDGRHFEDKDTVVFDVGARRYRNHLRTSCPGLSRLDDGFNTLITETFGSQLCEGDTIRVADSSGLRAVGAQAYPRCVLGWFEPVPKPPKKAKPARP